MAFRNERHRQEIFSSREYRQMVREWVSNGSPVPLAIFQNAYFDAFWDKNGNSRVPAQGSPTQREAFVNVMRWTGRAPDDVEDWDDWLDYENES